MRIEAELIDEKHCMLEIREVSQEAYKFISRILVLKPITIISCIELLYIAYTQPQRNKLEIVIIDKDKKHSFHNFTSLTSFLASLNNNIWPQFEVFLSLRKKGKNPIPGPRDSSFLLIDKKTRKPTHYILVLEQNNPIRVSLIKSFIEEALKNKWEPIIAIVDTYGDITFYTPQKLEKRREVGEKRSETKNRS